ncbi:hypothetical protein D5125_05600 [Magnetovirga frankeli]|uniref:tetratricopeptide repeat protein n=1 Tax=Magnetovirga frankeli TaxID=947516 RepID=UPI001AF9B3E8|nr:hypothetical protein D5125_05600 [gamma proteobacterium SS-5]
MLLVLAAPVQAACPDLLAVSAPADRAGWLSLRDRLLRLQGPCLDRPEYYALLGAAELHLGRISQALLALERSLMLLPDQGGALMDYAEALYHSGDLAGARALNRQLQGRSDLPPGVAEVLARREQLWRPRIVRRKGVQLGAFSGFDSNLNSGADLDRLTLTLPDGPAELWLIGDNRPVSGAFVRLQGLGFWQEQRERRLDSLRLGLSGRLSEHGASNQWQLQGSFQQQRALDFGLWDWGLYLSHLNYGGSPLYSQAGLNTRLLWDRPGLCQPLLAANLERQLFAEDEVLDGTELRLGLGGQCRWGKQRLELRLDGLSNRAEDGQRPGGDRTGWALEAQWHRPLLGGSLLLQGSVGRSQDESGYSPLLSAGARRRLDRAELTLQFVRPLDKQRSWVLSLGHYRQQSNLPLFDTDSTQIELGVIW